MDNIMDDIFTTSVHIGQRRLILLMFVHTPGTYMYNCTVQQYYMYNNTKHVQVNMCMYTDR